MSIWEAYETSRDGVPQLYSWEGSGYSSHTWDDWRRGAQRGEVGVASEERPKFGAHFPVRCQTL